MFRFLHAPQVFAHFWIAHFLPHFPFFAAFAHLVAEFMSEHPVSRKKSSMRKTGQVVFNNHMLFRR